VNTLGNNDEPLEVFPPEIFIKDIEPLQNYEVTVIVRNITKKVRRFAFKQPKTNKFKLDYDMEGPLAAGLAVKMNVSFETDALGDFHDCIEISSCENNKDEDFKGFSTQQNNCNQEPYRLYLHALQPGPDVQFEPLVNFKFIPINESKTEIVEFKNEGKLPGNVRLSYQKKTTDMVVQPSEFTIEPDEIKQVEITLKATEPDFLRKLIEVEVLGQDKIRNIDVNATSVEHHLSIVFEEGGGQKSSLNFGTLYMGEKREYPASLVNNGPKPVSFNIKFLQGIRNLDDDLQIEDEAFVSPNEAGRELTERVLTTFPLSGEVPPYSQIPIKFVCRTKKVNKGSGFSDHTKRDRPKSQESQSVIANEEKYEIKPNEYSSVAVMGFNIKHEPLKVQMMAKACFPDLKLNKQMLQFGECPTNDRRDFTLTIKNKNEDLPIDFDFTKVANFKCEPQKGKLMPSTKHTINVSFEPKSFGVFNNKIILNFLKSAYQIPITLMGSSNSMESKEKKVRGPLATQADFEPKKKLMSKEEVEIAPYKRTKIHHELGIPKDLLESTTMEMDSALRFENSELLDQYLIQKNVKDDYNNYIKQSRLQREKKKKIVISQKRREKMLPQSVEEIEADPDIGLDDFNITYKEPQLSTEQYPLYVEKPIDRYEPIQADMSKRHQVTFDENRLIRKKGKPEPNTQAEVRDCSEELDGTKLQKISAGPQAIDFKNVFVKSTTTKGFTVRNDLRQCIYVRLVIEHQELAKSGPLSQVIEPGQDAGFDLVFCSTKAQNFKGVVTYFINDVHAFKFLVSAQADPVHLELQKNVLKFHFADESTNMSVSEDLVVTNNGNDKASFQWQTSGSSVFVPNPMFGTIQPGRFQSIRFTFSPPGPKPEDEMITMKIEDGVTLTVKCQGFVTESRCLFQEKLLDYGAVPVGIRTKEELLHIKNVLRTPAVFYIKEVSEDLQISPMMGRIAPDSKQSISCSFLSSIEKQFSTEIEVMIRGGNPIKVPVRAHSVVPQVKIVEEVFDFGGVTFGDSKTLDLTLENESSIEAKLIVDLREFPEFELNLYPEVAEEDDLLSEIMVPITEEKYHNFQNIDDVDAEDLKDPLMDEDLEEEEEEDEDERRHVQINLRPNKRILKLQLKYTPGTVEDPRNFELPIKLAGIGMLDSLSRIVKGVGVKPRFIMIKPDMNFGKKVIAKGSKPMPHASDASISNPDHIPLTWAIDKDALEAQKVFQISPTEGRLDPNSGGTIRVTFNPLEPIEYFEKVPLYLDDETEKPYLIIELRGEGTEPKIFFDRREVILPVVPLGIQSKTTFMVCHNGYENLELDPKIASEVGKLPITWNFPDGNNLGVTKQKLKVEAMFMNSKPLSFTTHFDFYDDEGNKFSIPVSGTTDNSLFTVFSFLQRNSDEYGLEVEEGKPIKIYQDASSDKEEGKGGFSKQFSRTGGASSVVSRTARSLIGYNPVPLYILERNCEYVRRWLNLTCLQNSTIQNYPLDMINSNGSQIYDMILYLSGKKAPGNIKNQTNSSMNKKDALKNLITQYEELINFLKVNGAHLNTVRPEYLLSFSDYNKFLKQNPSQGDLKQKTLERMFPYLSAESWITLFFQVTKIYYLNRVTPKSFKNLPGMPSNEASVESHMQGSNLYSVPEAILLKWMQYHYNKVNPLLPKRLTNFDADLQDGRVFAALIQSHYGNAKKLKDIKTTCYNDDHLIFNAQRVLESIEEIRLNTHMTAQDIANPSARELLLFCVQLYQSLPHYIPKAQIEFPATLGDQVTKNIELSNPSKNPISYWVQCDGSKDFSIEQGDIRIEPGSTINFPIQFQSRISAPVSGKVIFTNKKEGNVQAAAMVFELVSNVHSRNSVQEIPKTTKLYNPLTIDLDVQNPFGQDLVFQIQIIHEKLTKDKATKKNKPGLVKDKKKGAAENNINHIPDPFYCKMETVRIKKNGSNIVPITFLPFELGVHKSYVVFSDENVGEMQYTIIGNTELPDPFDSKRDKCSADETYPIDISLPPKNVQLEKAKTLAVDRTQAQKSRDGSHGKGMSPESQFFEVEISSPYYTGPSNLTIYDTSRGGGLGPTSKDLNTSQGKQGDNDPNKLILHFSPKSPATYPCLVILKSQDRTDIRVFEVTMTAIPQMIKAQLEFVVPARGAVTQEIPIVNNSERDWVVKANLTKSSRDKNGTFNINAQEMQVKKKTTNNFLLSFKPYWTCEIDEKLVLNNATTNEIYEYDLKGIGEEPLAEDHIILSCQARQTTVHNFEIKNTSEKMQTYRVETDLNNVTGADNFKVKPKETAKYPLSMTPILGGVYTGSITFYDNEDRFIWYTVEVRTESPKPEKTLELKSFIRKAVGVDISLENPLEDPITFEVFYNGEGLLGESAFQVEPQKTGVYELIFSPLKTGYYTGTIGFLNEKVGEFWYDLVLTCEDNPIINLDLIECELGKNGVRYVDLENPTGHELHIDYSCTNPTNFEVIPEKVIIPPYESAKVCIQYSPSNLDIIENGSVIFENEDVGKWEYYCEGKGLLPTLMEPQPISTSVGNSTSAMLSFKNPFREPTTVMVSLETDDTSIFTLLLKRNKFNIGPMGILQIPYSFSPQTMTEAKATIIVNMSKTLVWKYPIRGIAESASTSIDFHFKTKSRKPLKESIKIRLPGFEDLAADDVFTHEINVLNPVYKSFVEKSVLFEQLNDTLETADDELEFTLRFEPLRPFKANAELVIYKSTGGRWKFNAIFEASDPEPDDVIIIQSPLHKTSSVSFKLTNYLRSYAEFQAYFTADSAAEFVVYPKSGMLESYGKEGTNFIISFTPTEYGKPNIGRLIIQTEEMQWSYEVRGSHPQYKIPEVKGGRFINNK